MPYISMSKPCLRGIPENISRQEAYMAVKTACSLPELFEKQLDLRLHTGLIRHVLDVVRQSMLLCVDSFADQCPLLI